MVRRIDADARRALLADAVWTLLRRGGLEAASVRAVAEEAGLAAGSVRHFFATQDELHVFAMEELERRVTARVERALDGAEAVAAPPGSAAAARAAVRAALLELLPTTPTTTADFQAHLQFIVKAVVHPPLAPVAQRMHRRLEQLYRSALEHMVLAGAARPELEPAAEARALAVLMEGLVLRRLTAPELLSSDEVIALLDAHLASLARGAAE
jgi:AcrR family transcriptional regulator